MHRQILRLRCTCENKFFKTVKLFAIKWWVGKDFLSHEQLQPPPPSPFGWTRQKLSLSDYLEIGKEFSSMQSARFRNLLCHASISFRFTDLRQSMSASAKFMKHSLPPLPGNPKWDGPRRVTATSWNFYLVSKELAEWRCGGLLEIWYFLSLIVQYQALSIEYI